MGNGRLVRGPSYFGRVIACPIAKLAPSIIAPVTKVDTVAPIIMPASQGSVGRSLPIGSLNSESPTLGSADTATLQQAVGASIIDQPVRQRRDMRQQSDYEGRWGVLS